jgi:hypothetical protein
MRVVVPFFQRFDFDGRWPRRGRIDHLFDFHLNVTGFEVPDDKITVNVDIRATARLETKEQLAQWNDVMRSWPISDVRQVNWVVSMNRGQARGRGGDDDYAVVALTFNGKHTGRPRIARRTWNVSLNSGPNSWSGSMDPKVPVSTTSMEFNIKDVPYCSMGDMLVSVGYEDYNWCHDNPGKTGWLVDYDLEWEYTKEHVFSVRSKKDGLRSGLGVARFNGTAASEFRLEPNMEGTWPAR